jgi:large subunit ribosomal protein L14
MKMKAVSAKSTRALQLKTRVKCVDNSGAREVKIIAVRKYKGVKRRIPRAGIADVAICSVKKGKEKLRKTIIHAVVVRQKKEFRRLDGTRVKFTDNAVVLLNPKTNEPVGTEIRSAIAKEVVERFPTVGKIASIIL